MIFYDSRKVSLNYPKEMYLCVCRWFVDQGARSQRLSPRCWLVKNTGPLSITRSTHEIKQTNRAEALRRKASRRRVKKLLYPVFFRRFVEGNQGACDRSRLTRVTWWVHRATTGSRVRNGFAFGNSQPYRITARSVAMYTFLVVQRKTSQLASGENACRTEGKEDARKRNQPSS